jgi:hypothetical protein
MNDPRSRVSEEQARRLWERAAELQAEALRREEKETGEERPQEGTPAGSSPEEDEGVGYSLTHVRQAAVEVGIDPEFLNLAMGEEAILALEGGGEDKPLDRAAARFLASSDEALEIRRRFGFPAERVWPVLEGALTESHQGIELLEYRGGYPLEGGIAVFESPYSFQRSGTLEYYATVAEVRRFLVRLIPAPEGESCEVIIHAPLRRSRRVNFWVGSGLAGGGGILGGLLGAGAAGALVGTSVLGTLPLAAIIGGLTLGGALGGGGLTRWGGTALYRHGFRLFRRALEKVFVRVERELDRGSQAGIPSKAAPEQMGEPGGS